MNAEERSQLPVIFEKLESLDSYIKREFQHSKDDRQLIKNDIADIKKNLEVKYVTTTQFENLREKVGLLQKAGYTVLSVVSLSVLAALLRMVGLQ